MKCPKCASLTKVVKFQTVEVDQCTNCKGLWFDMLEEEDLKKLKGSDVIDSGNKNTGKKQNKIVDINCPKCSVKMIRMVVNGQPHIWYEACPICYGTYFDAGEFKDATKETFFDIIKDILKGERH